MRCGDGRASGNRHRSHATACDLDDVAGGPCGAGTGDIDRAAGARASCNGYWAIADRGCAIEDVECAISAQVGENSDTDRTEYELLLDQIYDAALDPKGWSSVLDSLNTILNNRGFALFFQDRTTVRFNQFMGLDGSGVGAYANYYGARNPWVPAFGRNPEKIIAHELIEQDALERTEFYNDWLKPLGLHDAIGIPIRRDAGAFFLISGLKDKKAGYYTEDKRRLVERVTPHVRRAVDIFERLSIAETLRDGLVEGMDRLDIGVLLLDEDCRLLFANRIADTVLKRSAGLTCRAGRVRAADPNAADEFERTVRNAAGTGSRSRGDAGGLVVVGRKNGKAITALVCPRRSEIDFGYRMSSAMLFIANPDAQATVDETLAARLYGLSGAETRLLMALLDGTRLSDYADRAGITLNTAKGYLKQIFHKTGSGRQADLLRLFFADPVLRLARPRPRKG